MDASLPDIDAVFLDLDGTIYLGGDLIDGAEAFLERCQDQGVKRYFLSNNSSKSVSQYLVKLHGLGLDAVEEDVLLSTHDLLAWPATTKPTNSPPKPCTAARNTSEMPLTRPSPTLPTRPAPSTILPHSLLNQWVGRLGMSPQPRCCPQGECRLQRRSTMSKARGQGPNQTGWPIPVRRRK